MSGCSVDVSNEAGNRQRRRIEAGSFVGNDCACVKSLKLSGSLQSAFLGNRSQGLKFTSVGSNRYSSRYSIASASLTDDFAAESVKFSKIATSVFDFVQVEVQQLSSRIEPLQKSVVFSTPEAAIEKFQQATAIAQRVFVERLENIQVTALAIIEPTRDTLSQGAATALAPGSSLSRLGHSVSAVWQGVEDLVVTLNNRLSLLSSSVQGDPLEALVSVEHRIQESIAGLASTAVLTSAAFIQQPQILPVVASVSGVTLGVMLGNTIVELLAITSEGGVLPSRYNSEGIAAYFRRRPLEVLSRSIYVLAESSVIVANIYLDRALGTDQQNERLRAKELVDLITRLGPTAVKVGQALSIRPDLLSVAYLEELQTLQDRVPPFSDEEARRIINEGLGRSTEAIFMDMSSEPVAAASLGQVYKARLRETGEVVAVKVQRPGVLEGICLDLYILRLMAGASQRLPNVHSDLEAVLDNWARRFFDELDYVQEGKNAQRFAGDMRLLKNVTVPKVYPSFTSRKVLTSEWVEGEKLSESKAADLSILVTTALNCYLIQLLETGFLHADPHPGNLLRTPDGKLCVLDFGLMTEITQDQQYALIEYISHLVNNDFERVAEDLVVLGFVPPELVDPEKTAAVVPQLSRVLGQLTQGGGARYVNIAQVTDDLSRMAEEYVFVIPPYFALILRAFSVLEGIGLDNDPDYAIVDECYPYVSKRLITDDSPRARAALKYFLYGKGDRLDVARVENLLGGFQTFRELMAPTSMGDGAIEKVNERRKTEAGVDPAAREALQLIFAPKGSYLQELLLTELVRSVDALSREAQAAVWGSIASRAILPLPASLSAPGTWPLPLPGMFGGIVRGEWLTGRLSEEDQQQLLTMRRLWTLLEPQLSQTSSPASPADFAELVRDAIPVIQDIGPGLAMAAQRFAVMLFQRQALRLADDLDGQRSVDAWERDPASLARLVQPFPFLISSQASGESSPRYQGGGELLR